MTSDTARQADALVATLASYQSCAVAFSGGVDSAVVAKAAHLALADGAVAVTGVGPAVAASELQTAREVAAGIGIRHVEVATHEIERPDYVANAPDRCFHCKTDLYLHAAEVAQRLELRVIANGTNVDDLGDYRPGLAAAEQRNVRSPLVECGIGKASVRQLAAFWQLPVWDKPAAPCLASRIAYGQSVTPERLRMIEQAEAFLRDQGLRELRVRYHGDDLARIEVPMAELPLLAAAGTREALVSRFKELGFRFVTLDLAGFRSGSLNESAPEVDVPLAALTPRH